MSKWDPILGLWIPRYLHSCGGDPTPGSASSGSRTEQQSEARASFSERAEKLAEQLVDTLLKDGKLVKPHEFWEVDIDVTSESSVSLTVVKRGGSCSKIVNDPKIYLPEPNATQEMPDPCDSPVAALPGGDLHGPESPEARGQKRAAPEAPLLASPAPKQQAQSPKAPGTPKWLADMSLSPASKDLAKKIE